MEKPSSFRNSAAIPFESKLSSLRMHRVSAANVIGVLTIRRAEIIDMRERINAIFSSRENFTGGGLELIVERAKF